jgi:hypothetical protein
MINISTQNSEEKEGSGFERPKTNLSERIQNTALYALIVHYLVKFGRHPMINKRQTLSYELNL